MTPLQAAARLARKLPVREHRIRDDAEFSSVPTPIIIEGVRYESLNPAKVRLGISTTSIYNWLRSGRARYV